MDKTLFDRSFAPIWFDLTTVVQGFREGMPNLRPGEFMLIVITLLHSKIMDMELYSCHLDWLIITMLQD